MKRSAALAPLSRDHQHALDAALRLRRAAPGTAGEAVAYFLAFFAREGRRHFEIEEELILPALPESEPGWAAGVARVREDHAWVRAQAAALGDAGGGDDPVAAARELGERLTAHVRFEERELFPLLEQRLEPEALERLGADVEAAERR